MLSELLVCSSLANDYEAEDSNSVCKKFKLEVPYLKANQIKSSFLKNSLYEIVKINLKEAGSGTLYIPFNRNLDTIFVLNRSI